VTSSLLFAPIHSMKTLAVTTVLCGSVILSIYAFSKVEHLEKKLEEAKAEAPAGAAGGSAGTGAGGLATSAQGGGSVKAQGTYPAKHISISIARSPEDVYKFVSSGENLPLWAAGLSGAKIEKSGSDWIADSPMGKVKVRFAEKNSNGIADHDVTLPSGEVNHNPLRILKNGDGSEVVFTLYRLPRMNDKDFASDAGMIEKDLATLKKVLEQK
jgi:hypothetical protein